jgi:two-component system NarL family response regulator
MPGRWRIPLVTIKALLVEDHRLVREALRDALANEPDIAVVGEAGDAAEAFERTRSLVPDVVVVDIGLPDLDGTEVASRLKETTGVDARIVALSARKDQRSVTAMLRAGARAYVTKSSAIAELPRAIRAAAAGQTYLCPEVADLLVTAMCDESDGGAARRLSPRERQVLGLIAKGARSPAIADQLGITVGTIEVHRRNIMRKLEVRTVAELTRYAVREGLVAP